MQFFGTEQFNTFCERENLIVPKELVEAMEKYFWEEPQWQKFVNKSNHSLFDGKALNLLENLLRIDPEKRLTPKEALEHDFIKTHIN